MRFLSKNLRAIERRSRNRISSPSTAGFTIAEVLVASVTMLVAVSIAGNGVVNLLQSNYRANVESELRNNTNRTLEFVSNEVRRARIIADTPEKIISTRIPKGGQAILAFQIPDPKNPGQPLAEQIVYYVHERENPWLGPKVLWRHGPTFDNEGNYLDAANPETWKSAPMMDMVMGDTDNATRRDCDPYRKSPIENWQRFPVEDNQVKGIYSCVKRGGGQVILASNTRVAMTTADSPSVYSLSSKVSTRSSDRPYYLTDSSVPSLTDPDPAPVVAVQPSPSPSPELPKTPPFSTDVNGPNNIVLIQPATIRASVIQIPPSACKTNCYVGAIDPVAPDDRYTADLTSGSTTDIRGTAGSSIAVFVEGRSNIYGNTRNQRVNLYTAGQNLPSNLPNLTLNSNQVLVAITNLRKNPNETYIVLVNIIP